jgi:hypothetical protein
LYERFEPFPGAVEVDADRYEIAIDGRGTGEYGLRVTYELPPAVTSAEMIGFYRSRMPSGWSIADDQLCVTLRREAPTPPIITPPAASLPDAMPSDHGLILGESRLTVFTTDGSPLGHDRVDGITFELRRVGDIKYLVADEPNFACGPPETDRFAIEFDRPVEERSDP